MTSVLKGKKLAVKTPKYQPPQDCHCAGGCKMLPLTCTVFPIQFSDTWKQGFAPRLEQFSSHTFEEYQTPSNTC